MKGNNELRLNVATVIEAMQQWVDSAFYASQRPVVDGVRWDGAVGTMIISLKEPAMECEQERSEQGKEG